MSKIRFIDSIMGSGKTEYIIREMNKNSDEKYIYSTRLLDETDRIKDSCPTLGFKTPKKIKGSKSTHMSMLMKDNENISISQELLKRISKSCKDMSKEYNLILDEVMNLITMYGTKKDTDDINSFIKEGVIKVDENDMLHLTGVESNMSSLSRYDDLFELVKDGKLFLIEESVFISELPLDIMTSFKSITIMSYLVEGSVLYQQLSKLYDVEKYQIDDEYNLVKWSEELYKERSRKMYSMINFDTDMTKEFLSICKGYTYTQQKRWSKTNRDKLKSKIRSVFVGRGWKSSDVIFSLYGENPKIRGYSKSFLAFNTKSVNKYKDVENVAYLIERHPHPSLVRYIKDKHNITIDVDKFCLDEMIQFIWRSRIRQRQPINLCLVSYKMNELLREWGE